jgi:hypothetical protein
MDHRVIGLLAIDAVHLAVIITPLPQKLLYTAHIGARAAPAKRGGCLRNRCKQQRRRREHHQGF